MSRSAEELLEFDKLKEIVGGFTTCAPGRRAVHALAPRQDARRAGRRIHAGARGGRLSCALARRWDLARSPIRKRGCARLAIPASVLAQRRVARRCFADGNGPMPFARHSRARPRSFRGWPARAEALPDLRQLSPAIRRAILPNGEISDDASPQLKRIRAGIAQAREKIQRSLEAHPARARRSPAGRRRLHHAAQRPLRDSRARLGPPRRAGRGSRRERHGPDRFRRAARSHRSEQSPRAACATKRWRRSRAFSKS